MNAIADYALIGDCHSAALVGRDGSVDWACFPRFDSPSVFARIVDEARGGFFRVAPPRATRSSRAYVDDTNVLATVFDTPTGRVEVTDCMPLTSPDVVDMIDDPTAVRPFRAILRRVRCTEGYAAVEMVCEPRFEYGRFSPRLTARSAGTAEMVGGADGLVLRATRPVTVDRDRVVSEWDLRAGEVAWVELTWSPSFEASATVMDPTHLAAVLEKRLDDTIGWWKEWVSNCCYEGPHTAPVRRSALALKALTYAPSGAVLAAPTTSLPEDVGGERNWDYRFTWLRDTTLTLTALSILGLTDEAVAYKRWLERTAAGRPEDLQVMYGIGGERFLPEIELGHLAGHRGSRPVRIGNGAVDQLQLDNYGSLLRSAWLFSRLGGGLTPENWRFLTGLAEIVCERWRQPDQGIWEIRDDPRHFVHSKLNCWVALDRAVKLAEHHGFDAPLDRWRNERDLVRACVLEDAAPDGWLHQAVGHPVADASVLQAAAFGLVATTDPVSQATIKAVRDSLEHDGLVHRYLAPDGLHGDEGAFLLCSFWLLDCLIHGGRLDEAHELLDRLLGLPNDVGLYAEEADPATGDQLGNFPQAFTHMALVLSCSHLAAAEAGEIPDGAHDYCELAVERLVRRQGAVLDPEV